ncbi:MAG TPA: phosphoglycolate phosphatase [Methanosarcinaceae archaeon]|nr:phosphoglycolate phosphatase [Methanosarcinaceae archaeon]
MKFKAIVLDIDGTITHKDRRLNLRAAETLRTLDIPVVLATGNISCYAIATAKLIGLKGYVIAENGGVILTGYDKSPIISDNIEECEKAFKFLSKHYDLTKLDPEYRKTEIALRRDFDMEKAREMLKTQDLEVEIIDTKYAIHIKSNKINKNTGLKNIAKFMGLTPADFVAIGDSVNDAEMIQSAGFGIAVANGDAEAKKAADHVTKASFGDGAVEAIEYLSSKGYI